MDIAQKESTSFQSLLKDSSKRLIKEDGKTIINYVLSMRDNGILQLSLLPYLALYCRSAQDFLGKCYIENEMDKQISDMRNGLKVYSGRYSKGKAITLNSDEHQDELYKGMLRFSFMKSWKIHKNLGVYFDIEGHIIGDTQILNYFLNCSYTNVKDQKEYAFKIGKIIGERIILILEDICGKETLSLDDKISDCPKYGYRDFNTNRKNDFFNHEADKELNLILLHVLSSIGFVRHILRPMLPQNNLWVFRVEYIVSHYAWSGLKKIKQHYDNEDANPHKLTNDINLVIAKGADLFPSAFRNCMMHYDLYDNEIATIFQENYNFQEPFYGLIESCFEGRSYNEIILSLEQYILEMEECLLAWFHVDMRKVKWDI